MKVAERGVQYADNNAIRSDCHLIVARILQLQKKEPEAEAEYKEAARVNPNQFVANLAIAQASTARSKFIASLFYVVLMIFFLPA